MASLVKPVFLLRCQQSISRCSKTLIQSRKLPAVCCSTSTDDPIKLNQNESTLLSKDPLPVFLNEKTQAILQKITGFELEKIFRTTKMPLRNPKYKLMVQEELEKEQAKAVALGKARLQMPPVMKAQKDLSDVVLSNDTCLDKLNKKKLVFTDISLDVSHKKRFIVVREPDGKLRHASVDERARLIQTYFPFEGRKILSPKMFQGEQLEKLLEKGSFQYILDKACIQFEPDHPDYIQITQRTYEFIRQVGAFDTLRSTRHFGPMVFYYIWYNKVDRLLMDMIERNQISDAADVVRLYNLIHTDSPCAETSQDVDNDLDLLKIFCVTSSTEKPRLELTLQVHEDKLNGEEYQESRVS
ncbi:28S ribosomal protein S22, mitochondrial [Octopus sinensis]|uniref:28S ribosomal protein S22, mitochondrial n=1 Tax=Octopus sinensis TaxID=2607531 RepID=A0A6P7SIT4_9MOLL|nr:28S ribosomal protein S22, mitochondrial [Octopus sinensis]